MITTNDLLRDLKRLLRQLEDDLHERIEEIPEFHQELTDEYNSALKAERTAETFQEWSDDMLTQAAVAWILSCVFIRFMEDNDLITPPRLSGPGDRLFRARDEHELYFRAHPKETDREYLLHVFNEVGAIPAARDLFDRRHNLVHHIGVSGDGAAHLLQFWQKINPNDGELCHDFTDEDAELLTRVASEIVST